MDVEFRALTYVWDYIFYHLCTSMKIHVSVQCIYFLRCFFVEFSHLAGAMQGRLAELVYWDSG